MLLIKLECIVRKNEVVPWILFASSASRGRQLQRRAARIAAWQIFSGV